MLNFTLVMVGRCLVVAWKAFDSGGLVFLSWGKNLH